MRERLIELLKQSVSLKDVLQNGKDIYEWFADHLLENGVIVPKVQIGQTFYHFEIYRHYFLPKSYPEATVICENKVDWIRMCGDRCSYENTKVKFNDEDIGKKVFLTKEEAENALKARERE